MQKATLGLATALAGPSVVSQESRAYSVAEHASGVGQAETPSHPRGPMSGEAHDCSGKCSGAVDEPCCSNLLVSIPVRQANLG